MKDLGIVLLLFYIISIRATVLVDYGSIENLIMEGDQSNFSGVVFMKPNKEYEELDESLDEGQHFKAVDLSTVADNDQLEDNDSEQNINNDEELNVLPISLLRRKPWKSCLSRASKLCYKACKIAYKTACSYRSCAKRLKKSLKKECKRNCKSIFLES